MAACRSCGAATSATQKACPACGASVSDPVASSRKGTSLWLGVGAAVAVYALFSIGLYLVWPRSSSGPEPDDAASASLRTALAEQFPPFIRLDRLSLDAVQLDESGPSPVYIVTFSGEAVLVSDVYRQSRAENDVVFLAREGVEGTALPLTGTARLSRTQDGWNADVSFSPKPLLEGLPRAAFQDYDTIIEGSPEEAAYLESRDRAIEEATRTAAANAAARQRALEQRREADRLAAEAQAERARLLLAKQAQAAAAEEARIQAERQLQATRDEDARRAEELRRQEAQPRTVADPTVLVGGRVPKGTKITVRLSTGIRTDRVAVEDRFTAETVDDIVVRGQIVVPAGATVRGIVASVQPATRTNRRAKLDLRFDLLSVGSRSFPMRARAELNGPGLGRDGVRAGVGAGIGAIIGGLLGGSKGAVVGGAAGGGGAIVATEGQELDLPAGSRIRIEFDSALDVQ